MVSLHARIAFKLKPTWWKGGSAPTHHLHIMSSTDLCVSCADPGSFSGTAEALFYRRAMQNSIELPVNISQCADYITGSIMGQSVVVITSGEQQSFRFDTYAVDSWCFVLTSARP